MAAKGSGGRGQGSLDPKVVAAITAALGMHLQNERVRFRILNITKVQSSDLNFWGVTGRLDAMRGARRGKW